MKQLYLKISLLFVLFIGTPLYSQDKSENLIGYWKFDAVEKNRTKDEASGKKDKVKGNFRLVEGVKGNAIKCDGFTTSISRDGEEAPEITGPFTIQAWVAPQAYPWNWCAIYNQEYHHQRGIFFGIDAEGRVGLHAAIARQWRQCISEVKIPFMKWSHMAATFDPDWGIRLYINGEPAGELEVQGDLLCDREFDLQIGRNHQLTVPSSLNRAGFVRVPASYSFDGIIDELKIVADVLSAEAIVEYYHKSKPHAEPKLKWRKLPHIPVENTEFGAFYTKLKYDADWDSLWRDDQFPDIVVTFPGKEYAMVFWKGTNYNMNLVTENGKWIADQSAETFGEYGCMEHMSDKQNRYSHVRLIENNCVRVVVHWRYALTDIRYEIANIDPVTNWGDWADEYYSIYPDGIAVRHFLVHGQEEGYSITEPTLLSNPGEKPEDNIDMMAVTLANVDGEVSHHSYATWPGGKGGFKGAVDDALISVVNVKSTAKPFYIYEYGSGIGPYGGGIREIDYRYSKFHSRNHWPVTQVPCDGRFVLASDRVTSSAIISADPVASRRKEDNAYEGRFIMGISDKPIEQTVQFAKFWLKPPNLEIKSDNFDYEGYNRDERSYSLISKKENAGVLSVTIDASTKSPLVNPVFIIKNWGMHDAEVMLGNKKLVKGQDFTFSIRKTLYSKDLLVWFNLSTQSSVKFSIIPLSD